MANKELFKRRVKLYAGGFGILIAGTLVILALSQIQNKILWFQLWAAATIIIYLVILITLQNIKNKKELINKT
ncbi:MAG: hypothetical protein LBI42_09625 [Chitinispirillales bacterium]|nr:hypothetical protein [Chitinispirillales bacterium]